MTWVERSIVGGNVLMASGAALVNLLAARASDDAWRAVRVAIGTLAIIYALAYAWLFTHPDSALIWSSTLRGLSILTWPIVWTAPALMHLSRARRARRMIAEVREGGPL